MKILIEIDDNDYTDIITDSERNLNHYERLIKKGVPQITGHEDCISRKAVLDLVEDMTDQFGVEHRVITEGVISMLPPVTPKPMQVDLEGDGYADGKIVYDYGKCPKCGWQFEYGEKDWEEPYCCHCGQKLKWFEEGAQEW